MQLFHLVVGPIIPDDIDRDAPMYLLRKFIEAARRNPKLLIICATMSINTQELSSEYKNYFKDSTYRIDFPDAERRERRNIKLHGSIRI